MPIKVLTVVLVLVIAALYVVWDLNRTPVVHVQGAEVQDISAAQVPDFSFVTFGGETRTLYDFKGKTVLINIWASWCAPCVAEFPDLLALAGRYPDDIVLLGISVDQNEEAAVKFLAQFPAVKTLPNVIFTHDADKVIAQDLFQTYAYPETFILNGNMQLIKKVVGTTDWLGGEVMGIILTPPGN